VPRETLLACGDDVTIYDWVRIVGADQITIGDHVIVDDFVFLQGGTRLSIGSYVHIASYASITGGGEGVLEDFVGIAAGARIFTGTDVPDGTGLAGPTIPSEFRHVKRGRTVLEEHVFVGANAVVLPGVTIGQGAVIGALSFVAHDVEPWTVNVGTPARPIKKRPAERMLELAEQLRHGDLDSA
jgi:acetyltransferase-like isoleucine patch superfamily enzyme